jgi:hypothetical protein
VETRLGREENNNYIYVVKTSLTILLTIFVFSALAQKYRTCTIYQYLESDSVSKKIVATQNFNKDGKVIRERCNDYFYCHIILKDKRCGEYSEVKARGRYEFSYRDTFLQSAITYFDNYGNGLDTITDYFYYKNNRLTRKIAIPSRKRDTLDTQNIDDLQDIFKVVYHPNDTFNYSYSGSGNLIEITHYANGLQGRTVFEYDSINRLRQALEYNSYKEVEVSSMYQYADGKYQQLIFGGGESEAFLIRTFSGSGNIIEEKTNYSIKKYVYGYADRLIKAMYYSKRYPDVEYKLTTTHEFVYE